jgi:cytidylate kinase
MWKNINYENCVSYIGRHAASEAYARSKSASETHPGSCPDSEDKIQPSARPSVTISRMCGSGGKTMASELAKYLQSHTSFEHHWTIFDKNLIEKVLEEHHLSRRIAEFVPEGHKSLLAETIEKWRGLHPPTATIVKQTAETIWNLAASGYVILVGRASNVITEKLDNVFHVRLVASLENRIARVEEVYEMGRADAREYIRSQDADKRRYMKQYFDRDIDEPLLYHTIINTDYISYENAARLIGDAVITASNRRPAQALTAS